MPLSDKTVLVFGATGQQGGSVAQALKTAGWSVRALVRDPSGDKAAVLRERGIETVPGDLRDAGSIRAAMAGAHGVFSVQPSSGQGAMYGFSDEDEVRSGIAVADIAVESAVRHLVYSSANASGQGSTGMGHFDSKSRIEAHVQALSIDTTIVRPSAFMEILTMPGFGLPDGRFEFFMRRDQPMQFLAAEDIGKIVATIFADPGRYRAQTLEIAGDAVTGAEIEAGFIRAAERPIAYRRVPDEVLAANPFLAGLARLVDDGRLAGRADLAALRAVVPNLLTFENWLAGSGSSAFQLALSVDGSWDYGNG